MCHLCKFLAVLHHVGIEVAPAEIEAAAGFFELVGFERVEPPATLRRVHLARARRHPGPPDARGGADRPLPGPPRRRRPDFEATVARLREHGFEVEPKREHWGQPRALAIAPGGHRVELMAAPPQPQT